MACVTTALGGDERPGFVVGMQSQVTQSASNLVSFDDWLSDLGKTRVTGFRWRKLGLIEVFNIFGRLYVSREAIADFEEKAKRGDFAREAKTPARRGAAEVA